MSHRRLLRAQTAPGAALLECNLMKERERERGRGGVERVGGRGNRGAGGGGGEREGWGFPLRNIPEY